MKKGFKKMIIEKGQGLTEYVLILAFIAGVAFMMFGGDGSLKGTLVSTVSETNMLLGGLLGDKSYAYYFKGWHDKSSDWLINNTDSTDRLKADQEALLLIASKFLEKDAEGVKTQINNYSNDWGKAWLDKNINSNYNIVDSEGWSEVLVPLSYKTNNIDDDGYVWLDARHNLNTINDLTDNKAIIYENQKSFTSSSGQTYTATEKKSVTTDRLFYSDGMINQGNDKANDRAVVLQVHYNGEKVDKVRISARSGTGEQAINKNPNSQALAGLDLTVGGTSSNPQIISVNN